MKNVQWRIREGLGKGQDQEGELKEEMNKEGGGLKGWRKVEDKEEELKEESKKEVQDQE